MKRKLAIGFILMIAAMAFLTISCAKEVVQSQAETTSQPEAPVASEQPVETAEQTEPPAEAAPAPAGIDTAVVNERILLRIRQRDIVGSGPADINTDGGLHAHQSRLERHGSGPLR